MIVRSRAARAAASVLVAGSLVLGVTGCTFLTPQATLNQYEPADGIGTNVGTVAVRNVIALINDDGHAVSLLITLINTGDRSANVALQYQSGGEKTTTTKYVNAHDVASFGNTPDETQIIILNPGVKAGQLLSLYVQYGSHEGKQLLVPVLTGDSEQYEGLKPPEILK